MTAGLGVQGMGLYMALGGVVRFEGVSRTGTGSLGL